jgi:2-aminoadipate transaminase
MPGMLSMAGGLPDATSFPHAELAAIAQEVLDAGPGVLQYATSEGDEHLRAHIAQIDRDRHGRVVDPDTVLITTGSQQGLTMAATVLADAGDVIAVPHPCYLGALQTFAVAGLRTHPVAADGDRLDLDGLERDLRAGLRVRAMYVVANHGNPDGQRLRAADNARLAALADHWGFWLLEDDPYRELWFDTPPAPGLSTHTSAVISLGSFSKTVAPGLRVGWLHATGEALQALVRTKQSADLHTSSVSQALITGLLETPGWLADHTQQLRTRYASRAEALESGLRAAFDDHITVARPSGGMFAWACLHDVDTTALLDIAVDNGVCFVPGPEFDAGGAGLDDWLRLSFATLDEHQLGEAVDRLARSVAELRRARRGRSGELGRWPPSHGGARGPRVVSPCWPTSSGWRL